jgi:hypothetical protein
MTFTWRADKKRKRTIFARETYRLNNQGLRVLEADDIFKYLGVVYTPSGVLHPPADLLDRHLHLLKSAPLKPQQKLFILRTMLLPKFYHRLVFSNPHIGVLRKLDIKVRCFVRGTLHLPHDFPNCAFYTSVRDGGLGLSSLRWMVPILIRDRGININSRFLQKLTDDDGKPIKSQGAVQIMMKKRLAKTCDGAGLVQSSKAPAAHTWISDGSKFLSGRDYITCIHTRYQCLYTKARGSRGRLKDVVCSRGCAASETLNHIVQQCWCTHGDRIKRHNNIVQFLKRSAEQQGYTTHVEEVFTTPEGKLRPDLVLYSPEKVVVVDVQVINDQFPLRTAHHNKIVKYKDPLTPLLTGLRPAGPYFTTFTISWRGNICDQSASDLITEHHVIKRRDLKCLSSRTLIGSAVSHRHYSNMTASSGRVKKGEG